MGRGEGDDADAEGGSSTFERLWNAALAALFRDKIGRWFLRRSTRPEIVRETPVSRKKGSIVCARTSARRAA